MAESKHLVITVHGIRTYGDWQDQLKTVLEAAEPGVTVRMYRYGFFSSPAFLIPLVRYLAARQFRQFFCAGSSLGGGGRQDRPGRTQLRDRFCCATHLSLCPRAERSILSSSRAASSSRRSRGINTSNQGRCSES